MGYTYRVHFLRAKSYEFWDEAATLALANRTLFTGLFEKPKLPVPR
jgi:hypothetical protein